MNVSPGVSESEALPFTHEDRCDWLLQRAGNFDGSGSSRWRKSPTLSPSTSTASPVPITSKSGSGSSKRSTALFLIRRGRGYKNLPYLLLKAQYLAASKTQFVVCSLSNSCGEPSLESAVLLNSAYICTIVTIVMVGGQHRLCGFYVAKCHMHWGILFPRGIMIDPRRPHSCIRKIKSTGALGT